MSVNTPAISVIIPAYNQAIYVSEAIRSVLGQTNPDFELIVVDDGSTDDTPQILAQFQDSRIRVVRQPNAGLSAARNTGLRQTSAPLVTFLDSDDYFLPNKLEVLSRFLKENSEVGLVAGRARYIDRLGNVFPGSEIAPTQLDLPQMLYGNPICVSGILMRRVWFDRVGVFDEMLRACEDWDLWLRLLAAGCQMVGVEHYVVAYRIHQGQMTSQSERMRKAIHSMLDKFFSQPDLPESFRIHENAAYASGLVHAGVYAYISNELDKGQQDLAEAVQRDPTLKDQGYERLVKKLVSWAPDPRAVDPAVFLQRIISNPPPRHPVLVIQLRRALADMLLGSLFNSSHETRRARRRDVLKAVLYKPDWLLNRGVLRMLVGAWLPFV